MPPEIDALDDQDELIDTNKPGDDGNANDALEDRGDVVEPALDPDALKQVAGEGVPEEGAGTDTLKPGEPDEPGADAGTRQPGTHMIPISRFNEVNERYKQLAAQNQQLLDALTQGKPGPAAAEEVKPAPPDSAELLKAKRTEYHAALMEGKEDDALRLQEEIESLVEERATQRAVTQIRQENLATAQQQERLAFQSAVAEVTAAFPQLDANNPDANHDAITFVVAKRDALIAQGKSAPEALREASESVAKLYGFGGSLQPAQLAGKDPDTRAVNTTTRNARAASAQPAPLSGVGNRTSAPARQDVEKMSEAEFEALPDSEKSRLRGD